jgi:hypothetical protein
LRRATEAGFEIFLTADQNLQYQQNLARSPMRIIVLAAASNTLEDLLPSFLAFSTRFRSASQAGSCGPTLEDESLDSGIDLGIDGHYRVL